MTSPTALIRRDGAVRRVPAVTLQPGDVVLLEAGDQVPADLRLTEATHLSAEESALTGESLPVQKTVGQPLYMSSLITQGRGEGVVTEIGMDTEIGKIAALIHKSKPADTTLQKRLGKLGKALSILALVLCALLFLLALAMGRDVAEMLVTAISLAVAAVPEGLPAIVTIVLAIGVSRLAKAGIIVRKLPAVETLGSVSVVCSDKTGTLTQNRMTVTAFYEDGHLWNAGEKEPSQLLEGFVLCNNALLSGRQRIGDPMELALLDWALRYRVTREALEIRLPRVDEEPFSSQARRMVTRHVQNGSVFSYMKGASDMVLDHCRRIHIRGTEQELTASRRRQVEQAVENMAAQGLRVLALALGMDKNDEDRLMRQPPRSPKESLMTHGGWFCTIFYGLLIAGLSLGAFLMLPVTLETLCLALGDAALLARAQTYAFTALGISQLFHAIGMRDQRQSVFAMHHRENPMMFLAFFLGLGLQAAVTEIPFFIILFGTAPLALHEWGFLLALSSLPVFAHQLLLLSKGLQTQG